MAPRKRELKADEHVLWGKVAKTTRPMSGRMEDLLAFDDILETSLPTASASPDWKSVDTVVSSMPEKQPAKPGGQHHPLEKPVKRKLAKGRLALQARIDLHGLIQSEAHALLHGFLVHAHERGLRHVLVITGKGSSMGSDGALKRAVPLWFSKPDFRHLISSYETAASHHGGEGAMYVRLSRARADAP